MYNTKTVHNNRALDKSLHLLLIINYNYNNYSLFISGIKVYK